jgi:uncharacterized protein YkwD
VLCRLNQFASVKRRLDRMKAIGKVLLLVSMLNSAGCAKPPGNEEQFLEEVNHLRMNPAIYAQYLEARLKYYQGNVLRLPGQIPLRTQEGASAVRQAIRELRASSSAPPLKLERELNSSARDHVRDIGPKGLAQHEGTNGSSPETRVRKYIRGQIAVGEVISFGPEQSRDVIIDLVVDDGVLDRGHRKILLDPRFRRMGAACGPHTTYGMMCVIDLTAGYEAR